MAFYSEIKYAHVFSVSRGTRNSTLSIKDVAFINLGEADAATVHAGPSSVRLLHNSRGLVRGRPRLQRGISHTAYLYVCGHPRTGRGILKNHTRE